MNQPTDRLEELRLEWLDTARRYYDGHPKEVAAFARYRAELRAYTDGAFGQPASLPVFEELTQEVFPARQS